MGYIEIDKVTHMKESTLKVVNKALESFDWEMVFKMYKIIKRKIGEDGVKIPGISKLKKGEKLNPEKIKEEVRAIIYHVISQDLSEYAYGPWTIFWVNGEWALELTEDEFIDEAEREEMEGEAQNEAPFIIPIGESKIQIYFVPQSITVVEKLEEDEIPVIENIESSYVDKGVDLHKRLEHAIKIEDYELASKLRDQINRQNGN